MLARLPHLAFLGALLSSLAAAEPVAFAEAAPAAKTPGKAKPPAPPQHGVRLPQTFIRGPVFPSDFPDPSLAFDKGWWYTFSTHPADTDVDIQIARSKDFLHWEIVRNPDGSPRDALYYKPSWTDQKYPNTWAPDVVQLDDGTWIMYFSATVKQDETKHCVGVATSKTIIGPYQPLNHTLVCPLSRGGAIDASGFKDWGRKGRGWGGDNDDADDVNVVDDSLTNVGGWTRWWTQSNAAWTPDNSWGPFPQFSEGGSPGQRYIAYKIDGNSIGGGPCSAHPDRPIAPGPILLQKVANDGITLQGKPVQLLDNAGASDEGVIEAPSLIKSAQGKYVLFFSSACYSSPNYTLSYAVADSITGPYKRHPRPLLKTGDHGLFAPGGADANWNGGEIVFHADLGKNASTRQLYVGRININGDVVTI